VHWLVALCLVFAAPSPALAEEPVRIGLGFGLAFLPAYICEHLKLIEKHGKESHLDLRASYRKVFGQYDKLRGQIVVLSHAEAVNDLVGAKDAVTGYFSSAPYTEIALADGRVHKILSGSDVIDGKASFLILGASKGYIAAHPKVPEAITKAIDEAARIIHDDPRRAAEIYLVHEPSRTLDAPALAGVLSGLRDEFGGAVRGIGAFADFMGRHGELKSPPASWKEIVAPALLSSPGS
jgi:NitT/TauT family transport system substrate-binding protein